jgi:cell pole-organizing protein PopZ
MSDANAQEPTMEEILASIRRIISEDDAPAADAAQAAAPEPEEDEPEIEAISAPEPVHEPIELAGVEEEEDVLELTDAIVAPRPPAEALGDLDVFTRDETPAPPPAPAPAPTYSYEPEPVEDSLVSAPAADRASSYFGNLSRSLSMPSEGRTLEDLVSELVRPLLTQWLDAHLPSIVEAKVQAEVERLSRSRR